MTRLSLLLFASLGLAACSPSPSVAPPPPLPPAAAPVRAAPSPAPTSSRPPVAAEEPEAKMTGAPPAREATSPAPNPLQVQEVTIAGERLTVLSFDSRSHRLEVVDQPALGSRYQRASQVSAAQGALATINGGFFTPEGQPLGLLYHQGKRTGSLNTASSLGSGVVVTGESGRCQILRREDFRDRVAGGWRPLEALQSGPFLLENGEPVAGLSAESARIRSLVLWDGGHHFALAQSGPLTLRDLARGLAGQPLANFRIASALNLDGGRSSDFHLSAALPGGEQSLRRWWNKPVRNYLIVKKR
ncbi:phosphodiester glycosidase family protein [Roseibacillus ishigakijimensis]|uniref:Phosphodiester glycosidase family protein n=1 Tax=Roseibacillus ishigakijimensis TaxID=454146 RepID=A0A934RVN2_9BACT|nr:phosphodiester glycosidase family protein [Roseibacillus ishigakijimensis]MBK1835296.1 phosphodiester glycosidase family protein [Roseibacillus ishigakijimensis]